jgi:transposase
MPAPLSAETRGKIIAHKRNKEKESDIAKWLSVSESTVTKTWNQFKDSDSFESKLGTRGRKPVFGQDVMDKIIAKVKEQPDITLEELVNEFDLKISISALSRKLKKANLNFKKRLCTRKSNSVTMSKNFAESGSNTLNISKFQD